MEVLIFIMGIGVSFYSGIVVNRLSKFGDKRNELKEIILRLDFMYEANRTLFTVGINPGEISIIASDLFSRGHVEAGEMSLTLMNEMITATNNPRITKEEFNPIYQKWQEDCRNMKPNWKATFKPTMTM